MSKEPDKNIFLSDKSFHVVLIGTGLDILLPGTYNSKIQDVETCSRQINGGQYIFIQTESGNASIEPYAGDSGQTIVLAYSQDAEVDDMFRLYSEMYLDMSEELPETDVRCMAVSIPSGQPGLISCQLILEAKRGVLLMGIWYAPENRIDEFLALAGYIKPFSGEIPEELSRYAEDTNDSEEGYDRHIVVDTADKEQVRCVISRLIDSFDELQYVSFGRMVDGEFMEYEYSPEPGNDNGPVFFKGVGDSSELAFFTAAARYPELHGLIIDYIDLAIGSGGAWTDVDEETPKGLHAAFALAMCDEKYIPKYIELLKTTDMDHEVYQLDQIALLVEKWKDYDNGIRLLCVRCMTASGQHGPENLSIFLDGNEEFFKDNGKKEKFLKLFMLDVSDSHDYRQHRINDLMEFYIHPVLETIGIDFDEKKLAQIVATMNEQNLPGLANII